MIWAKCSPLESLALSLNDTAPANTSTPSTTAQPQQTWLPPPSVPRQITPQPTFTDFDLFQPTQTVGQQATSRRAPSLDSTLQHSFNAAQRAFVPNGNNYSAQSSTITPSRRNTNRPPRPPVPLFHSNSTGDLGNTAIFQQQQYQQQMTDFENMGGGGMSVPGLKLCTSSLTSSEVNVAYDGTFGDLSSAGDANMFNTNMSDTFEFDLKQLLAEAANNRHTSTFTPFEDGSRETGATVSPKDVFNNDSVPPSTSFTNLTTPGSTYLETPEEEFQTSPLFSDNLGYGGGNQNDKWFSLFPDTDATPAPPTMERTISASSAAQVMVHPGGESLHRKRSSTTTSPTFSPVVKHSSVAGVAARKRDKPLPPIMVDDSDPVAMKRARNTAAARKSRAKKVAEREDLEAEIADLKSQVEHWKAIALGQSLPAAEE
ncbi:hypothetical protein D0861_02553 [Hortaea werneckii]|uniref:BZIP domain-containing protein n=1 Tax=Hortaea werneckii TaxID=91943 RepID=A0A3M7FUF6_HORWE|nr:hypothetical protein D0861_02553 [Hortaea werneckii]